MISHRDPAAMTEAERLAELASLFAAGYLRYLAKRPISSGETSASAESMAPLDQVVNKGETPPGKETQWKKA